MQIWLPWGEREDQEEGPIDPMKPGAQRGSAVLFFLVVVTMCVHVGVFQEDFKR